MNATVVRRVVRRENTNLAPRTDGTLSICADASPTTDTTNERALLRSSVGAGRITLKGVSQVQTEERLLMQFNNNRFERVKCPMCGQKFINGNKLNRHKRTCPAKENQE